MAHQVSPVATDLVRDLQVLNGVLDLVLRQLTLLDGQLGLPGVGVRSETRAVRR